MAAHFAKRNTKFGGGKRGRAKIPSPQPPSFLPARAFSLAREARHQFRSKNVRAELYNSSMVPEEGVEPSWITPHDFESCASASSATRALCIYSVFKNALPTPDFRYFSNSLAFIRVGHSGSGFHRGGACHITCSVASAMLGLSGDSFSLAFFAISAMSTGLQYCLLHTPLLYWDTWTTRLLNRPKAFF
jgi:hypothetical protein